MRINDLSKTNCENKKKISEIKDWTIKNMFLKVNLKDVFKF